MNLFATENECTSFSLYLCCCDWQHSAGWVLAWPSQRGRVPTEERVSCRHQSGIGQCQSVMIPVVWTFTVSQFCCCQYFLFMEVLMWVGSGSLIVRQQYSRYPNGHFYWGQMLVAWTVCEYILRLICQPTWSIHQCFLQSVTGGCFREYGHTL